MSNFPLINTVPKYVKISKFLNLLGAKLLCEPIFPSLTHPVRYSGVSPFFFMIKNFPVLWNIFINVSVTYYSYHPKCRRLMLNNLCCVVLLYCRLFFAVRPCVFFYIVEGFQYIFLLVWISLFVIVNLSFDREEGVDSIHLLKEIFSQPKLDIFRGV